MKHTLKNRIIGLLLGILIGVAFTTSTAAISQTVQKILLYNNLKITLDGEEVIPKDANGVYVEPFAIDGTTYLPVRAISNALGLGVDWDQKTSTVVLTSPQEDSIPTSQTGTVVYDANGVKITYKGIEESWLGGYDIKFLIENNTDSVISIMSEETSVNGFMIYGSLYEDITPGKKTNTALSISENELETNDIVRIEEVETIFYIMEDETLDIICITDSITIYPQTKE